MTFADLDASTLRPWRERTAPRGTTGSAPRAVLRVPGPLLLRVQRSLTKLDPEAFKLSDYLTDDAMKLLPLIDQVCLVTGEAVFRNLMTAQI
ncbi:uncharacterized protein PG986_005064 [Apiospora aurea]|uniref:Uncharacterized protein n=1 Tax=Apiospora aurea TaxID=335848 RepID=A0ABR1QHB7_9PEZI